MMNHQVVLKSRPSGIPQPEHFEVAQSTLTPLRQGEFLVKNLYLSVDPAQRGYVNDEGNYLPPVEIGEVMRAMAVGQVVESRDAKVAVGSYLYGWFGWQEFCNADSSKILRRVDPNQISLSAAAGILGINGLTAYLALYDAGRPRSGDTVLVTAGAGAVGSIVGQLAKAAGCRTIAVVGSNDKGSQCMHEFGYDAFINYSHGFEEELVKTCPEGVDVFFDNVAGPIADCVVRHMNVNGRVVQCGTMAIDKWTPTPQGPRIEREVLTRRLQVTGFVIFDHMEKYDDIALKLTSLVKDGLLTFREDIEYGLERAPAALSGLYKGQNKGKKLIQLY